MDKTLCLVMIVKNESTILKRCFDSISDYIDYWVICDTGSTDNTKDIITTYFKEKNIPGELHETPWVNFGHNRTISIQKAYKKADYLLVCDADFYINIKDTDFKKKLTHNIYLLKYEGNLNYRQKLLMRGNILFKYKGVTHECLTPDCENDTFTIDNCDLITINHIGDGGCKTHKFERDIMLLTKGIEDEPNNSRYYFYLANSYFHLKHFDNAIKYYKKRISMGGWNEEVYYSMYRYAQCRMKLKDKLNLTFEEVALDFINAYKYRPSRLEALYDIVKYCRVNDKIQIGYAFAIMAYNTFQKYPQDILFINDAIHKYMFMDELAIAAYYANNHTLAISINNKLIQMIINKKINLHLPRIIKNKEFSVNAIKKDIDTYLRGD